MKILLAVPLLLFLLLSISPAYATVDVNQTVKVGATYSAGIRCINSTDAKIYCYIISVDTISPYTHKIIQVNFTGQNQTNCTLSGYTSLPNRGNMALLNSTHLFYIHDDSGCDIWDITDIGAGNCILDHHYNNLGSGCQALMFSSGGLYATTDTNIYTVATGGLPNYIVDVSNYSNFSAGYWNKTIYWNSTSNSAIILSLPNRSDNNQLYVTTISYASKFWPPFLKYSGGELNNIIPSPYQNESICLGSGVGYCYNDLIQDNYNMTYLFTYDKNKSRVYRQNFSDYENTSTSCNIGFNNYQIGTTCVDANQYVTNPDNCTVTYGTCAAGTFCQQLTPQLNVTNDLIENYTQCAIYYKLGGWTRCSNICWNGQLLYSNCQGWPSNPTSCSQCPAGNNGFIIVNATEGYYTNTWYSNQSTVSVPAWTIACVNQTTKGIQYVIDNNGTNTTEYGILTQAGNNVTNITNDVCYNTSTTCYAPGTCNVAECYTSGHDNISSLVSWTNSGLGTPFGADLIALLLASIAGVAVFMKDPNKNINTLLAVFLVVAGALSFIGFLTYWFLVLEGGVIFIMIFWKVRGG